MGLKPLNFVSKTLYSATICLGLVSIGNVGFSLYYQNSAEKTRNSDEYRIERLYSSLVDRLNNDKFTYLPEENRDQYVQGLKLELEALSKARKRHWKSIKIQKIEALISDAKAELYMDFAKYCGLATLITLSGAALCGALASRKKKKI